MGFQGNRLRQIRETRGITQEALAEKLGVRIQQIWRWESSKTDPAGHFIVKIAESLDISSDYLLGLSDDPAANLTEEELTPMERKLIMAVRQGQIMEALETLTAIHKQED